MFSLLDAVGVCSSARQTAPQGGTLRSLNTGNGILSQDASLNEDGSVRVEEVHQPVVRSTVDREIDIFGDEPESGNATRQKS